MARSETIEAKSKGQIVGTGEITVYETIEEAVEAEGAQKVLDLFNRQNKINELNRLRAAATAGTTIPKVLRDRVMALSEDKRAIVAEALGISLDDLIS